MTGNSAGVPRAYWREVAIAVAAKFVALALIYLLFFAKAAPPSPGDHIFSSQPSQEEVPR